MRKVLPPSILIAFALTLSACRSSAPSNDTADSHPAPAASKEPPPGTSDAAASQPRDPTPTPRANDPRPVLVAFGDSLTAGLGTDPGQSYPDYLQADLD